MQTYEKYFKPPNICREKAIFFFLAIAFTRQQHGNELTPTVLSQPIPFKKFLVSIESMNLTAPIYHVQGLSKKILVSIESMGLTAPDLSCPSSIKKILVSIESMSLTAPDL